MAQAENHQFDIRVVEKHLRRGTVGRDTYREWIDNQEDCAELGEDTTTSMSSVVSDRRSEGDEGSTDSE